MYLFGVFMWPIMIKAASNAAYLTGGPTVGKLYNLNVIKLTGTPNPSYIICKYEKYSKHGIDSISILQLFGQYLFIPLFWPTTLYDTISIRI